MSVFPTSSSITKSLVLSLDGLSQPACIGLAVLLGLCSGAGWADEVTPSAPVKSAEAGPESAQPEGQNASEEQYRQLIMAAGRQLQQGNPAQTLKLLEQATKMLGGRTTADILFLAAQAHMGLGNREMATRILGRLAKEYPQVDRLQLDYAAMLYSTGRDEEADEIFREIREKKGLPEPVQRNVEKFLERIHRRKSLLIDYDFSVWKDDNVNNATEVDQVEIPLFGGLPFTVNEKPIEAWVARTGVNLLHRMPLREDGSLRLNSRAGLARNTARNAKAHNRTWLNLSTGPQWFYLTEFAGHKFPGYANADVGYEKRWRGGDPYSGSAWVRLSARQSLPRHWALGGYVRYWKTRYSEGSSRLDPKGQAFNLYAERTFRSARVTAGWTFSAEHPDLSTQRWKSHQGMLAYETVFGLNWHVSAVAALSENRYKGFDPIFQRRRKDQHRNLHVTVSNRSLSWNGYLPEVTIGMTETKSNIDLYDRDNFTLRLGLQKLF